MTFDGPYIKETMKAYDPDTYLIEVKLFSHKEDMITYVNQLKGIENVEITKIEDHLYKVLIIRKKQNNQVEL